MSETTTYEVGQRVRYVSLNRDRRAELNVPVADGDTTWDLLPVDTIGTVNQIVPDDEEKMFVIFDEVKNPLDFLSEIIGMPTGWPMLTSEVAPL